MPPYSISPSVAAPTQTSLLTPQSFGGSNTPSFSRDIQQFPSAFDAGRLDTGAPYSTYHPISVSPPAPSITVTRTAAEPDGHGSYPTATSPRWRSQATSPPVEDPEPETGESKTQATAAGFFGTWFGLTAVICTVGGLGTYAGHKGYQAWNKNGRPRFTRSGSQWFPSISRPERSLWYAPVSSGVGRGSHRGDDVAEPCERLERPPPVYAQWATDDAGCSGFVEGGSPPGVVVGQEREAADRR